MIMIESPLSGRYQISVRERDLDNFLLEELRASTEFRTWFLGRLAHCLNVPEYSAVAVGKNPKREVTPGQTDLSLVLLDADHQPMVHVLIESKVASGFQPEQAERYAQEVAAARERLGLHRAAAVLVAPNANLAVLDNPQFDSSIRLEEVVVHLRARREKLLKQPGALAREISERIAARINLLDALIHKRNYTGNWTPNPIPERLDFMTQYRSLAKQLAPHFKTTDSSGGPKATTMIFTVPPVGGLPIANIRHDFPGRVSMVLRGLGKNESALADSGLLPQGASTSTKKSGSLLVTLAAPVLDPDGDRFGGQEVKIGTAIRIALKLHEWARDNAAKLTVIFADVGRQNGSSSS
jgi:hypothetical protein